jgi:penicillin-binding protein 1C
MEVFEFWPSDLLQIFNKYGVVRRTPPKYEQSCNMTQYKSVSKDLEIVSPKKGLRYVISYAKRKLKDEIPLRAVAAADVKELKWFVNGKFVGKSLVDETLFYEVSSGQYDFVVVDDQGRTSSRRVDVGSTF